MEDSKKINIEVSNTYKDHFLYVLNNDLEEMVKNIRGTASEIEKLEERIVSIDEAAVKFCPPQYHHVDIEFLHTLIFYHVLRRIFLMISLSRLAWLYSRSVYCLVCIAVTHFSVRSIRAL